MTLLILWWSLCGCVGAKYLVHRECASVEAWTGFGIASIAGLLALGEALGFYFTFFEGGLIQRLTGFSGIIAGALATCLFFCAGIVVLIKKQFPIIKPRHLGIFIGALSFGVFWGGVAFATPAQGWDGLSFWLFKATQLVNHSGDADYVSTLTGRHGNTIPSLFAASSIVQFQNNLFNLAWPLNLLFLLSFLAVISPQQAAYKGATIFLVVAVSGVAVPLVENHFIMVGYSEFLIGCVLVCVIKSMSLYRHQHNYRFLLIGFFLIFLLARMKFGSLIYIAPLLAHLVICRARSCEDLYLASALAFIVIFFVAWCCFQISLSDESSRLMGVVSGSSQNVEFGIDRLLAVARNILYALLVNQSYSVWPLIFVFALFFLLNAPRSTGWLYSVSVSSFWIGLLMLGCLQIDNYFFETAVPESDTGGSRHLIPFFMLGVFVLPKLIEFVSFRCGTELGSE